MTPAFARMKEASRTAVELCGGVDGAAATTGRGRSTCGRWMNRNEADLPTLDSALALDGVAVARGEAPPIVSALARELGKVLIDPPEGELSQAGWLVRLSGVASVTGQLHSEFCAALADGEIGAGERRALRTLIDAAQTKLAAIDAALAGEE